MTDCGSFIQESIIRDMSEGVMTIGFDGCITSLNPAGERILARPANLLVGRSFARCFFDDPENDAFNQTVLDAIYDNSAAHENVVSYFTGSETRQLHVTTSFLHSGEKKVGVIAVLGDISELVELRDAVAAMERIKKLNAQLELRNQLLSETFGRFLSDEIVRQLLETPDGLALGGNKRTLTVLMSDLRGFTALSERMNAQDLLSMLNHYLGEMTEIIQRQNGTIIEFIGDGIMAIFGAPAPTDSHATDAVAAAVDMQARMEAVNDWNVRRGYPVLEMGIGVNTGEVIVGNIGSEKRTKYGVVGQNVNLCGRIESYTVGGHVLISPQTREMCSATLEVEQELEISPKGVKCALRIAQITAVGHPYNLRCQPSSQAAEPLQEAIETAFYLIVDKHSAAESILGHLTALSHDEAILETAESLELFANLKLELAPGEVFAKVLQGTESGWRLRFTALPEHFDDWLKSLSRTYSSI